MNDVILVGNSACVAPAGDRCGEGPVSHAGEQSLQGDYLRFEQKYPANRRTASMHSRHTHRVRQ
jgi:hypothetical protein